MKSAENSAPPAISAVYEFGDFRFCGHELQRRGVEAIALKPRAAATLRCLLEHSGTVLDKERIMEEVWPDSIVEENNLAQAISKLRQVLGETPGAQQCIVTVPGRGYRFALPVRKVDSSSPRVDAMPSVVTPTVALPRPWRTAWLAAVLGLLLVAGVTWYFSRAPGRGAGDALPSTTQERSLAVMPFKNLSMESSDAFFAEGLHLDLLSSLAKLHGLKVIARGSTAEYRTSTSTPALLDAARNLQASHVLTGSVRRAGDRLVVNAALIDARDERQIWSERYERSLTDSLSLQGEVALEIAGALRMRLTPAENADAATKPTSNPDAYVFYLRGREAQIRGSGTGPIEAISFYQNAIELDPGFGLARARLSMAASEQFRVHGELMWKERARSEAEQALRLQPQLGEAHLALSLSYLWGDRDLERASHHLARAAESLPNSAEIPLTRAFICKMRGEYPERIAALERAAALDPRNRNVMGLLHVTYRWTRQWREALEVLDRAEVVFPDARERAIADRALYRFYLTGDLDEWERTLDAEAAAHDPQPTWWKLERSKVAMLKRDFATAEALFRAAEQSDFDSSDGLASKDYFLALLSVARGTDAAEASALLSAARDNAKQRLASAYNSPDANVDLPKNASRDEVAEGLAEIAVLDAFAGRRSDAIAEAIAAAGRFHGGVASIEQNQLRATLALVYARSGESDKALDLIEELLIQPVELPTQSFSNIVLAELAHGWQWDPLRTHPRFQKLLSGSEPHTVP